MSLFTDRVKIVASEDALDLLIVLARRISHSQPFRFPFDLSLLYLQDMRVTWHAKTLMDEVRLIHAFDLYFMPLKMAGSLDLEPESFREGFDPSKIIEEFSPLLC